MFSWSSQLVKSSRSIRRSPLAVQQLSTSPVVGKSLSNNPPQPLSSPGVSGDGPGYECGSEGRGGILRWLAFASGFGLAYWSVSGPSEEFSFFAHADCCNETLPASNLEEKSKQKTKYLFGDSYRRRIFFNYEKRMRIQSPPEKVFEYFASIKTPSGEVLMTPTDLMRAIVPVFPPSESDRVREGYLRGEKAPGELHCAPSKFFMLFDTNNDGLISFPEYIFFVTLLSIPESSFSVAFKMFDLDNNGEIDKEEFKKVMALMRSQNRQGATHRDGLRLGLKGADSIENGGLLEYFFGIDGNASLKHSRFVQFLRDLHEEILRLEFAHYDHKSCGTISAKDFALSLVASADINHINKFLSRVDELDNEPHLRDTRFSFEDFRNVADLRKKSQYLSFAMFSHGKVNGLLTKNDFQRAASQVCDISLTENVVDLIFHIFDTNCDGSLSSNEFVRVLQGRESDFPQQREGGLKGLLSCWLNCCSSKRSSAKTLL